MTNLEVIEMLKQMQEKTAHTMGFFIGHVTQAWVIRDLLGAKIAELEEITEPDTNGVKTEGAGDEDSTTDH